MNGGQGGADVGPVPKEATEKQLKPRPKETTRQNLWSQRWCFLEDLALPLSWGGPATAVCVFLSEVASRHPARHLYDR